MKHTPETRSLKMLVGLISQHTDTPWPDVMGMDIDGLGDAERDMALAISEGESHEEQAACERLDAIKNDYIQAHGDDLYWIAWPEHVVCPRFNGDASYRLVVGLQGSGATANDEDASRRSRRVRFNGDASYRPVVGLQGSGATANGDPGQDVDPEPFDTSVL